MLEVNEQGGCIKFRIPNQRGGCGGGGLYLKKEVKRKEKGGREKRYENGKIFVFEIFVHFDSICNLYLNKIIKIIS